MERVTRLATRIVRLRVAEGDARADMDADTEADAEGELLEAVQAAEANTNHSSGGGWPKGED